MSVLCLTLWCEQKERNALTFVYTKEDPVASSDPDKVRYIRARPTVSELMWGWAMS